MTEVITPVATLAITPSDISIWLSLTPLSRSKYQPRRVAAKSTTEEEARLVFFVLTTRGKGWLEEKKGSAAEEDGKI
jgi:hypothetical protein